MNTRKDGCQEIGPAMGCAVFGSAAPTDFAGSIGFGCACVHPAAVDGDGVRTGPREGAA